MNKVGIIVGSVPLGMELTLLKDIITDRGRENVRIYAADGGIDSLIDRGIIPDEWVGDMDSASKTSVDDSVSIIKVSPIKDETDMELALSRAVDAGYTEVYIFGGTGGRRIEHTFANIQLMHGYALQGIKVYMVSAECTMFVIVNDSASLGKKNKGYVSVFSLSDRAENVSITGLFYEFQGNLQNTNALGVSNEYNGREAVVSVENGALLIVTENDFGTDLDGRI